MTPIPRILSLDQPIIRKTARDVYPQLFDSYEKLEEARNELRSQAVESPRQLNQEVFVVQYKKLFDSFSVEPFVALMQKKSQHDKYTQESLCFYALNMALFWLVKFEVTHRLEYFPEVLQCLIECKDSSFEEDAFEFFPVLFCEVISIRNDCPVKDIERPIKLFYEKRHQCDSLKLAMWLKRLTGSGPEQIFTDQARDLVLLITRLINEDYCPFTEEDGQQVLALVRGRIADLDLDALVLFARLVHIAPRKEINYYMSDIPNYIAQFVKRFPPLVTMPDCGDLVETTGVDNERVMGDDGFSGEDAYSFAAPLVRVAEFQDAIAVPEAIMERLDLLAKELRDYSEVVVSSFHNFANQGEYSLSVIYAFLLLAEKMNARQQNPAFVEHVTTSEVFDRRITIFDCQGNVFWPIFEIRQLLYDLYFKSGGEIMALWEMFKPYPNVISELFVFLRQGVNYEPQDITHALQEIMKVSVETTRFLSAEHEFFRFLQHILLRQSFAKALLEDGTFMQAYCGLFFQLELMTDAVELLFEALSKHDVNVFKHVGPSLRDVLGRVKGTNGKGHGQILTRCILDNALKVLHVKSSMAKELSVLCEGFFEVARITKSRDLLYNTISFLELLSVAITIKSKEMTPLLYCIKEVEGENSSHECFAAMMQLAAGTDMATLSPSFVLHNAKFVCLYVDAFWRGTKIIDDLAFITQLCHYSILNCQKCHQAKLDMMLLQFISKSIADGNINIEKIRAALKLIAEIATVVSSIQVVTAYISLLSPINNQFVSPLAIPLLESMDEIVCARHDIPAAYLSLSKGAPYVKISPRSYRSSGSGRTFTFWIYLCEATSDVRANLLSVRGPNGHHGLNVLLSGTKILVEITPGTISKKITTPVPTRCWTFIALSFQNQGNQISVRSFLNNKTTTFKLSGWDGANFLKMNCQIGDDDQSHLVTSPLVLIGSFGVFPMLNPGKLIEMSQNGPSTHYEDCDIYVMMESENSLLCLHADQTKLKAELVGQQVQRLPFADVLVRYVTIDAILPLFAQIEFRNQNGDMGLFVRQIVDLFFDLLYLENVNPNYSVLVYLLGNAPSQLTYELYTQFYARAHTLSNKRQQGQVLSSLILNPLLWCFNLDPENDETIYKIVDNWNSKLTVDCLKLSFAELLDLFVPVFWGSRPQKDRESLMAIRKLAVDVIIKVVRDTKMVITKGDLTVLLQYTGNVPIPEQCIDMLELISKLSCLKDKVKGVRNDKDLISCLYSMISFGNEDVTFSVIKTIVICCREQLLDHNLPHVFVAALVKSMSIYRYSVGFLDRIHRILHEDGIDLLPILCMIAIKGEPPIAEAIRTKLNEHVSYAKGDKTWVIWPTVLGIVNRDLMTPAVQLLIDSTSGAELSNTYAMMQVVSYSMGCCDSVICREFLKRFAEQFSITSPSRTRETLLGYLKLCFDYLFYHWPRQLRFNSPELEVFGYNGNHHKPKSVCEDYSGFFKRVLEKEERRKSFKVLLDSDENWLDSDLALDCLQIIHTHGVKEFYNMAALIAFFLRKAPESRSIAYLHATELLKKVDVMPAMKQALENAFHNKKCEPVDILSVCERLMQVYGGVSLHNSWKVLKEMASRIEWVCATGRLVSPCGDDNRAAFMIRTKVNELRSQWERLWGSLIRERGPWHQLGHDLSEAHWRRDFVLCSPSQIPARMKRNHTFDDHKEASFLRETGSIALAKKQNEEYKTQMEKIRKEKVPEIFDVKDTIEAPDDHFTNTKQASDARVLPNKTVKLVTIECVEKCWFLLFPDRIEIEPRRPSTKTVISASKTKKKVIYASKTKEILTRTWLQKPVAIEIFCEYGQSYFIVFSFKDLRDVEEVKSALIYKTAFKQCEIQTEPFDKFFSSKLLGEYWRKRMISNFRYLMCLNKYSARSFHNASVYPILPWVVSDYASDSLRLDDANFFRDLEKPVGMLDEGRFQFIKSRQKDNNGQTPAMWSSYAVSPLTVYMWLVRMEPFTTKHIEMQSGKFDYASRQFSSIPDSYRMVTTHLNDFRELIPEFFFQPEFLVNADGFDLGQLNDDDIGTVQLPNWAHNPIEFVYLHRKALESEYVSKNLHHWIDHMWGYKQRGEEAVRHFNTYDPKIYDTAWDGVDSNDKITVALIEASMQSCGQVPPQLFKTPHEHRDTAASLKKPDVCKRIPLVIKSISHAIIDSDDSGGYIVRMVRHGGRFCDCHVNTVRTDHEFIEYPVSIDLEKITDVAEASLGVEPPNDAYHIALATTLGTVDIYNVQTGYQCTLSGHIGRVNCISSDKRNIATGGSDSLIQIWDIVKEPREVKFENPRTIRSFRGQILCVSVSSEYHVTVAGCSDGSIFVVSTENGSVRRVIELPKNAKPRKLLVTKEWGFILVYASISSEDWIYLFTINGEEIRKRKLECPVSAWTTWSSTDGFDYVLMSDIQGRIHKFEAFYCDIGKHIETIKSVLALHYDKFKGVAVILSSDGDIRCRSY